MEATLPFNVNTTLGTLEIGVLVSYVLFGITTTQAYIYYSRFPEDSRRLKTFVAFVWLCEMAHTICIGWTLYTPTVTYYGNPENIGKMSPSSEATIFLNGIIATSVRLFFSYRVYAFSQKIVVAIILASLSLLYFVVVTATFIGGVLPSTSTIPIFEARWGRAFLVSWSFSVAADIGIASTLVFLLARRRNIGLKSTAMLVDKLIIWTVETGLLTSLFSIVLLICFLSMNNSVWIGLFTVESRLFANSFLASLNSRATLRALNDVSLPISMPMIYAPDVETTRITLSRAEPDPAASDGGVK